MELILLIKTTSSGNLFFKINSKGMLYFNSRAQPLKNPELKASYNFSDTYQMRDSNTIKPLHYKGILLLFQEKYNRLLI